MLPPRSQEARNAQVKALAEGLHPRLFLAVSARLRREGFDGDADWLDCALDALLANPDSREARRTARNRLSYCMTLRACPDDRVRAYGQQKAQPKDAAAGAVETLRWGR